MSNILSTSGLKSASELRAIGKAQQLKGNKLRAFVDEQLRAQQPAFDAAIAHLGREGYLGRKVTVTKSGLVNVQYQPPAKVTASKAAQAEQRAAKAEQELAQLKAMMAAMGMALPTAPQTVDV